ncbi:hypothetical protein EV426DRAFT_210908 [Tirmania nivea]|nr:hypothetical protein EV426DRAFT_210908 [Tirmania nivea]
MTGDSSPTTDHEHFTNIWRNYSSSGQWLHNCNGYRKLCDPNTDVPVVWLHGIPGSVLSSYIIERLREIPQFTVGWFYCRFGNKEKNTLLAVTRGILAQLLRGNDRLRPLMLKARQETDAAKLVSTDLAQELMRQCLEELQKSCVVIDGLDECDREERKKTMAIYTKLVKQLCNNLPTSVRVLFVSTDENDIRIHFTKAELIHLTAADNYVEMRDYARTWSKKIQELHQLSHQETEAMTLDVLRRANGMYLFCYLVLNNLLGQLTREDLDRELQPDNLPNGLGDAYVIRPIQFVL